MPLASITRDRVQALIGMGMDDGDFAKLVALQALASGYTLQPENAPVSDGLSPEVRPESSIDRHGGRP